MGGSRSIMNYFLENNKNDLILIGELSKLTNVNIKSLRYYEKIGVLTPCYVDPENGYRYYTYSQVQLVISIQFYVEMDIPLSKLHNYIDPKTKVINFRDQISYGIETAKGKIQIIENQLKYAEGLRREIDRCDKVLKSGTPIICSIYEKHCWCIEVTGVITKSKYHKVLNQLLLNIKKIGMGTECKTGLLRIFENNKYTNYLFAEINPENQFAINDSKYRYIEAHEYFCTTATFNDIISNLFCTSKINNINPKLIMVSELFTSDYDYLNPIYELKYCF